MTASTTHPAIPPNARCVACGYSLYKLEVDRCPECGRGFDRNEPISMGIVAPRTSWLFRQLGKPHSRFTFRLPWIVTGMMLVAPFVPHLFSNLILIGVLTWIVLFVEHAPAMIFRRLQSLAGTYSPERLRSDKRLIKRMLTGFGISLFTIVVPVHGYLLFLLFRADLNRIAQAVPSAPVSYREFGSHRVGPYPLDGIDRTPHELRIGVVPTGLEDPYRPRANGIVFILEDDPGYDYDNFWCWHLTGGWYVHSYIGN